MTETHHSLQLNYLFILIFIAELDPIFARKFLKKADKGDLLVSTVYNSAVTLATEMEDFPSL